MKIPITTQIDRLTIRDSFGSTFKKFTQPQDFLCLISDNWVVAQQFTKFQKMSQNLTVP